MLCNANDTHFYRMRVYFQILDEKAKRYNVDVIDLAKEARKSAWEEAVDVTSNYATNTNKGFKPADRAIGKQEIIIIKSDII